MHASMKYIPENAFTQRDLPQIPVARPLLGNLAFDVEPPGCSCRVRSGRRLLRENKGKMSSEIDTLVEMGFPRNRA